MADFGYITNFRHRAYDFGTDSIPEGEVPASIQRHHLPMRKPMGIKTVQLQHAQKLRHFDLCKYQA